MRHEIIKADNYLLVLDYKDVQPGDSFLLNFDHPSGRIRRCHRVCDDGKEDLLMIDPVGFGFSYRRECKRISAHLPLNGAPYLDGLDVLPILEDDVIGIPLSDYIQEQHTQEECIGFIDGYNKSRVKYKFTEEHVFGFLTYYNSVNFNKPEYKYKHPSMDGSQREYNRSIDRKILAEYIKSLQQPKLPSAFECEMELVYYPANMPKEGEERPPYRPKTFINSEGRTEWVGKYIYN